MKKGRFPNILNQAFFRRFGKSFPFGSNLGQAGEWGGFAQIWEVISLEQLEAFTKEIHRTVKQAAKRTNLLLQKFLKYTKRNADNNSPK